MLVIIADECEIVFGMMEASSAIRKIESDCQIANERGQLRPTVQFLDRISKWLETFGLRRCTLTIAWQVWAAFRDMLDAIGHKHRENAEIAFWYGIDPFGLDDEQKLGLLHNLPVVQAQDVLHSNNYDGTNYDFVYRLTLLATGDERQAIKARGAAMAAYADLQIARAKRGQT